MTDWIREETYKEKEVWLDPSRTVAKCATKDLVGVKILEDIVKEHTITIELDVDRLKPLINEMSGVVKLCVIGSEKPITMINGSTTYFQAPYCIGDKDNLKQDLFEIYLATNPMLAHAWDAFQTAFQNLNAILGGK